MKSYTRLRIGLKAVAFLLVISLLVAVVPVTGESAPDAVDPYDRSDLTEVKAGESLTLQSDTLTMEVQPENGRFAVTDNQTQMIYTSNPADYAEDPLAQGITLERMQAQMIITFLNDKNTVDKVDSFGGCVSKGGLRVYRGNNRIVMEYTFTEQKLTVPVILSLADRSLLVSVDYAGVREEGDHLLLNIDLLPYFGAARTGDKGYFLLPDGAGAYVSFNNERSAQGAYTMNVYGSDMTVVNQNKPNGYQSVLLPVYASIFTHTTTSLTDTVGRDVKAGYLTVIRGGTAGAKITATVSGLESSYNLSSVEFLYRSQVKASFLSRTWAEIVKIMTSPRTNTAEDPVLEYRFLAQEEACLKGSADLCGDLLFGGDKSGSLSKELYLDIYAGVKKKQQFLGIGYQAVSSMTTLEQTDTILQELQTAGVSDLAVLLRGVDQDGAYYGRIDSRLTVDRKVGTEKELRALIEKWGHVYPEVSLTEFSADGKGIYSFLHSVTGMDKKTVKRYDYRYSTGLRNYDRPTRYLLQPSKVEETVTKLLGRLEKQGINTLAPNSLGRDLYGDYTGETETMSSVLKRFDRALSAIDGQTAVMLESPNAYAMPYAEHLLYLPSSDSGHFISDGSVPFLQLVLDGRKSYSAPAMNYTANLQEMLLFAIESNSAPAFSLMWEDYSLIARSDLSNLYASSYAAWKTLIGELYNEWQAVRSTTENSCIADYDYISADVRLVRFENGATIVLNYGTSPYMYQQKTVAAKSYMVVGEGENQ
ncbi:MAG: hypothetical protein IK954_02185 [Clostridia bacterium]|nr:hypothetical protein [Clostridia bacterium]